MHDQPPLQRRRRRLTLAMLMTLVAAAALLLAGYARWDRVRELQRQREAAIRAGLEALLEEAVKTRSAKPTLNFPRSAP